MKKTLVVSLILLVALVGCAATTAAPAAPTATLAPTHTPAQEAAPTATSQAATEPPTATPEAAQVATPTSGQTAKETKAPPTPTATPEPPTSTPQPAVEEPAWTPDGAIGEGEYAHLVESSGVTVYWTTDAEFLYGALSAKTAGWVSVGFDPENKMQGANYVFGYVKDGQTFIDDMFGAKPFGPGSHPADIDLGGSNDILEFGGSETDGVTLIEFKIPLDSGDANDKPLLSGQSYPIIVAFGNRDDFSSTHAGRGYAAIDID
ncbi:MAG: hypothetical protein JW934_18095 [Anaerolineae bacterium]|nr:hypothetical protein [Anaerolineae bacterium]